MKTNVMLTLLMLVMSTAIFAQHRHGDPKVVAALRAEKMKEALLLSDDQFEKVKGLNEKTAGERMQLWNDSTISRQSFHAQMRKLNDERQATLKGILTDEQWSKWEDIKARHADRRKKFRRGYQNDSIK